MAQKLTPIRPPPSAVPDLGESYLTNPPPDPLNPTPGTPPVLALGKLFPPTTDQTPTAPEPTSSPKTTRSGRKRPFPQDSAEKKQKTKMAARSSSQGKEEEDSFTKLAKVMKSIESKIEQSEVRMATKIETKIDSLATNLSARLEKTEQALAKTHVKTRSTRLSLDG